MLDTQNERHEMSNEDESGTRFIGFLEDHNGGQSEVLAGAALRRLVAPVEETGKKGTVTLRVSIEPMRNTDGMVVTTVDVTEKLPQLPVKSSVFFTDHEGNLSRRDPKQQSLFDEEVREVAGPESGSPREVLAGDAQVRELRSTGGVR